MLTTFERMERVLSDLEDTVHTVRAEQGEALTRAQLTSARSRREGSVARRSA